MTLELAVHGAGGRMGQRLCALISEDETMRLVEAVDRAGHPQSGQPVPDPFSEVVLSDQITGQAQVVIDFSTPEGTRTVLARCVQLGRGLVIGTTGLTEADHHAIDEAAHVIPVLQASNFSLVVNVMHRLIADAARMLGPAYDIELLEAHHRFKKDAPSGTALSLAQTLCQATGRDFEKDVVLERAGDDVPRKRHDITVQTLRYGDHPGEHTVYFAALGERLEVKHVATSRDSYATGAIRAAAWLAGQGAGRYTMADVLGLNA